MWQELCMPAFLPPNCSRLPKKIKETLLNLNQIRFDGGWKTPLFCSWFPYLNCAVSFCRVFKCANLGCSRFVGAISGYLRVNFLSIIWKHFCFLVVNQVYSFFSLLFSQNFHFIKILFSAVVMWDLRELFEALSPNENFWMMVLLPPPHFFKGGLSLILWV